MANINVEQISSSGEILERLLGHLVIDSNNCWLYRGRQGRYGRFHLSKLCKPRSLSPYRYLYELYKGPIPAGLQIDHLCCEKSCCNPDHLEAVTAKENTARAWAKGLAKSHRNSVKFLPRAIAAAAIKRRAKTHCKQGHEFNQTNTYIYNGTRACRICRSNAGMNHYYRRRQLAAL